MAGGISVRRMSADRMPERFVATTQHPAWHGRLDPDQPGTGLALFANAVRAMAS